MSEKKRLSEHEIKIINEWKKEKLLNPLECVACQSTAWLPMNSLVGLYYFPHMNTQGNEDSTATFNIALVCIKCGYTMLFNININELNLKIS